MQALKATVAREINKADITEAETLVFEGRVLHQTGKQGMEPGEFYFRPTPIPETTAPHWFARLLGAKPKLSWRTVQTIVMACPFCAAPIMTVPGQTIEHLSPLTVASSVTCPYSSESPNERTRLRKFYRCQ